MLSASLGPQGQGSTTTEAELTGPRAGARTRSDRRLIRANKTLCAGARLLWHLCASESNVCSGKASVHKRRPSGTQSEAWGKRPRFSVRRVARGGASWFAGHINDQGCGTLGTQGWQGGFRWQVKPFTGCQPASRPIQTRRSDAPRDSPLLQLSAMHEEALDASTYSLDGTRL